MSDAENELSTNSKSAGSGSSDSSRTWLLVIGIVAVLAIAAGSVPRSATGSNLAVAGVDTINIDSSHVRLIIRQEGTGNEVLADLSGLSGTGLQLETGRRGDQLELSVGRRFWQFRLFSFRRPTLTVTLPESYSGGLQAAGSSGRVEIDAVSVAWLSLRTSSGHISVSDTAIAGDAELRSSSGWIQVEDVRLGGSFSGTTSSARLELTDVAAESYRLSSSSGRIEASGLSGGPVEATTSSGQLSLEADSMRANWQLRSSSGRINVELDRLPADMGIDFQSSSGSWQAPDRFALADSSDRRNRLLVEAAGPLLEVRTSSGGFRLN